MNNKQGRHVDISGINIEEIKAHVKNNKLFRHFIKCHSFIALSNNVSMQEVCKVMGVTRESVRHWKEELRSKGVQGITSTKKVGKRSRLTDEKLNQLKKIVKQRPSKYGYEEKKWTGNIIRDYVAKNWNLNIGIRTAQIWLLKIRG